VTSAEQAAQGEPIALGDQLCLTGVIAIDTIDPALRGDSDYEQTTRPGRAYVCGKIIGGVACGMVARRLEGDYRPRAVSGTAATNCRRFTEDAARDIQDIIASFEDPKLDE